MSKADLPEFYAGSSPLKCADVVFKSHPRAKRYLARIGNSGEILLTVPKRGTRKDALAFANRHLDWLKKEQEKVKLALLSPKVSNALQPGDVILFRGKRETLKIKKDFGRPVLCCGTERIYIADEAMDLSRPLKQHLRAIANTEFPALVHRYATDFKLKVLKVSIRDQKTRWGSCSTSGTISLNWRLVLADPSTRDYVIIHELMHMKRFDHSPRFWTLVEKACPNFRDHESWLKLHQDEMSW